VPGEETSSTLVVEIQGRPLAEEVRAKLTSATVDDTVGVPDMFVLRFLDEGASVIDTAKVGVGVPVRLSVQRSGRGAPTPLLVGEVTALEVEMTPGGTRTVIRGYDKSHRLFRGRRYESFVNQKPSDIARTTAQRAGIATGTVDTLGGVLDHVAQGGTTDWAFLQGLATRVGAVVAVTDDKLDFRTPTPARRGPASASSRDDVLVLEKGVNLVSLRATVTAADQVPSVEVRSWDVKTKRPIVGTAPAATSSALLDGVDPAALAATVKAPALVEPHPTEVDQRGCAAMASAIADRVGGSHAELEGIARGNPALRAGAAVTLAKVGRPFDGRYTLSSTRHQFSADRGYLTEFTVSNASDRTAYGVTSGGTAKEGPDRLGGVVVGIVSDVKDPLELGRVRVSFPAMSDTFVSTWARTVQPGAGKGRGMVVLPEVGDEVLVAFGLGDFDEPYVLGGLYNGKDLPGVPFGDHVDAGDGSIVRRAFVSRTGMVVELTESPDGERLSLSTNAGKQRISLVQKGDAAIEVVSEGPVSVTAKKDVTVSTQAGNVSVETGSGDVKLSGSRVSVSATSDLVLEGASVKVRAQGAAEVSGATAKLAGQASAELSAGGATTVKGGVVRIN
jgi:phage protein D